MKLVLLLLFLLFGVWYCSLDPRQLQANRLVGNLGHVEIVSEAPFQAVLTTPFPADVTFELEQSLRAQLHIDGFRGDRLVVCRGPVPGQSPVFLLSIPLFALGFVGWRRKVVRVVEQIALPEEPCVVVHKQDDITAPLVSVELGDGLQSLLEPLQLRVERVRHHLARELGLPIAAIHCRSCPELELSERSYLLTINGRYEGTGTLRPDHLLAIGPQDKLKHLRGQQVTDPVYGMPGRWITGLQRGDAERLGCMIFDPVSLLACHLTEKLRGSAAELFRYVEFELVCEKSPEVRMLVHELRERNLHVVSWQVLQLLLAEQVSIRDLTTILGAVLRSRTTDPRSLCELVRPLLASTPRLSQEVHMGWQLPAQWEEHLSEGLPGDTCLELLGVVEGKVLALRELGMVPPTVVTSVENRALFREATRRCFPDLVVLSRDEPGARDLPALPE